MGALTAKPYSFRNRTWELLSIESIDILDSLCSNIRIDTRNNIVERILPKPNDNINEEWITDKIRFCYDGFKKQRLSFPFYRIEHKNTTFYVLCSWFLIFKKIKINHLMNFNSNQVKSNRSSLWSVYTGNLVDTFTLHILKTLSSLVGINTINVNININIDLRKYYLFNNNIKTFDLNNVFLIIGCNPKIDSPILNMKIRQIKYKYKKKINICYIGSRLIINYSLKHLGITNNTLYTLFYGKSFFCKVIKKVHNIICLSSIGFSLVSNNNIPVTLEMLTFFLKSNNFIHNYITLYASDVSIYELGICSTYYNKSTYILNNKKKISYLLGVDSNNMSILDSNSYNIYHGHHANIGVSNSSIVMPSNTYIENTSFFMNCEGRFMVSNVAITKKKKINNNESVLYNLFSYVFNKTNSLHKTHLKRLFILFFYKNNIFFTKYKYLIKYYINLQNKLIIKSITYSSNLLFTVSNTFYNMDVLSKSSYYLIKLNDEETKFNI